MANPSPSHGGVFIVIQAPSSDFSITISHNSAAQGEDRRINSPLFEFSYTPRNNVSPNSAIPLQVRWRRINAGEESDSGRRMATTRDNVSPNSAAPDEDRRMQDRWPCGCRSNNASPNSEEETAVSGPSEAEGDLEVCAVCQENYGENQRVGVLRCRHRFHADCIGKWLEIRNVCPLCNALVWFVSAV